MRSKKRIAGLMLFVSLMATGCREMSLCDCLHVDELNEGAIQKCREIALQHTQEELEASYKECKK